MAAKHNAETPVGKKILSSPFASIFGDEELLRLDCTPKIKERQVKRKLMMVQILAIKSVYCKNGNMITLSLFGKAYHDDNAPLSLCK